MMVTIGMILVFVVPIVLLLLVGAQARFESLSHIQAGSGVRIIADSINEVYVEGTGPVSSGPGASKVAIVNIPTNTKKIEITENNEVVFTLETRSGTAEVVTSFFGEVDDASIGEILNNGNTPVGLYPLRFYVNGEGNVVIEHEGSA